MILELTEVNTFYGISHVLFNVSLNVDQGEVVALLGRNGAGKTTTMHSIMGVTPAKSGSIRFKRLEISQLPTHLIARKGIGIAPSDRRIYPTLTVRQNLMMGEKPGTGDKNEWTLEKIYDLFPKLKDLENHDGGLLSGGEQQMLTIGRMLMGNPDLLLLDEPSTGLAPVIIQALGKQVRRLKTEGHCILLAEQNARFAMELCDRCYVIDKGEIRFQGTIDVLRQSEDVMRRYLAV